MSNKKNEFVMDVGEVATVWSTVHFSLPSAISVGS